MDSVPVYTRFNCGPVSSRDNIVYTCSRPGYKANNNNEETKTTTHQEQVDEIQDWIRFMKDEQGVTNIVALLDDNELCLRNDTPQITLHDVYTKWWMNDDTTATEDDVGAVVVVGGDDDDSVIPFFIQQPINDDGAYQTIMAYIDTVVTAATNNSNHDNQQQQQHPNHRRVIVHCSSGSGRAALIAAAWLVYKYGCTPMEATKEVLQHASQYNVHRKGNVERLEAWVNNDIQSYISRQK